MMPPSTRVPEDEMHRWVEAAQTARVASYILEPVTDPNIGSELAGDDAGYEWEEVFCVDAVLPDRVRRPLTTVGEHRRPTADF